MPIYRAFAPFFKGDKGDKRVTRHSSGGFYPFFFVIRCATGSYRYTRLTTLGVS